MSNSRGDDSASLSRLDSLESALEATANSPEQQAVVTFDYSQLDPGDADELRAAANAIRANFRDTAIRLREVGLKLLLAKEKLVRHGSFRAWLAAEFGLSERSAQRYMNVARNIKSDIVSDLPITVAEKAAAPSTPVAAREEIIRRAEAGEKITVEQASRIISAGKNRAAFTRAEAKLTSEGKKKLERRRQHHAAARRDWEERERERATRERDALDQILQMLGAEGLSRLQPFEDVLPGIGTALAEAVKTAASAKMIDLVADAEPLMAYGDHSGTALSHSLVTLPSIGDDVTIEASLDEVQT